MLASWNFYLSIITKSSYNIKESNLKELGNGKNLEFVMIDKIYTTNSNKEYNNMNK